VERNHFLTKLGRLLRTRFVPRISVGIFGDTHDLWEARRNGDFLDITITNNTRIHWGSTLLSAVVKEVFVGTGTVSIKGRLFGNRDLPCKTLALASTCVSHFFYNSPPFAYRE